MSRFDEDRLVQSGRLNQSDEVAQSGGERDRREGPSNPALDGSSPPGDPVLVQAVEPPLGPPHGGEVLVLPGFDGAVLDPLSEAQLRSEQARAIFEAGEEAAEPWMDDYWALLGEGWSWRQVVYMLWEAQPPQGRIPKTQGELATEVLGLTSDRVIRTWKAENPAIAARIAKLTASALSKARSRVIRALIESAASANYRAHADRKLFLEMTGDYQKKQTILAGAVVPDDLEEMDEEDLRALAYEPGKGGG